MGTDTATKESQSSITLYWEERPEKYRFSGAHFRVEEIATRWDQFLEGAFMQNSLGNPFHQVLRENGLERIFSLRNPAGEPCCDIVTMPVDSRILSLAWGMRRGLKTSYPMKIDGQELIVLDAVASKDARVGEPLLKLVREFYENRGGKLRNEHSNSLALSNRKEIKEWRQIIDGHSLLDLFISEDPLGVSRATRAAALNEALILLRVRYWRDVYINGDDSWAEKVLDHLETFPPDRPTGRLNVIGISDESKMLTQRAATIMEKKGK